MKTTLCCSFLQAAVCSVLFAGCATPPTGVESKLFRIETNYVDLVETRTNLVYLTNTVTAVETRTNTLGEVQPVFVTNYVSVPVPVVTLVTSTVPAYAYTQGTNSAAAVQTAAAIGNLVAPGIGGQIAGAVAGLFFSGWCWLRSSRATKVAQNSAQVIEAAREVLKSLPNGKAYDSELVSWMQQHQAESGVLNSVLELLEKNVSNRDAKYTAEQIRTAVAALQKTA